MSEISLSDAFSTQHEKWLKHAKRHRMYKEPSVDVFPIETYKVSDALTIEAVPLEFYRGDVLRKHGEVLAKAIQESDGVIFEYFPKETNKIRNNKLVQYTTNIEWYQDYYGFAAKKTGEYGKNVLVMDPAHDLSFSIIRGLPSVVGLSAVGSFLLAGQVAPIGEKVKLSPTQVKAGIIASFVTSAALGTIAYLSLPKLRREHKRQLPDKGFTESNFRRIVVAKGIQNLSNQIAMDNPNGTTKKFLLLYPPVHWKGIKEYLDNPIKHERAFRIASAFKVGGLKESYFSIRTYQPNNGNYELKGKMEIA